MHGLDSRSPRRARGLSLALAVALALTGLAGCGDAEPAPATERVEYVAIGDSYTATGLPVAAGRCQQSSQNYPHLIALERPEIVLFDASCSGAETRDTRKPQKASGVMINPTPQFDQLSGDTDLVTVSLGGNDHAYFVSSVLQCASMSREDPEGAPCADANGDRLERHLDDIHRNLVDVLEEVQQLAPDARVLMVGYPRLLPDRGDCPARIPLAEGDVDFSRERVAELVDAQRRAAEDAGVEYVDVWSASEGHDICGEDPWVNDLTPGPGGAHPYHPTPAHQRAVAGLILEML